VDGINRFGLDSSEEGNVMRRVQMKDFLVASLAILFAADPAFAGVVPTPAPVMGAGIGALALLGIGYAVIRHRKGR
jgi:hypothetical protein